MSDTWLRRIAWTLCAVIVISAVAQAAFWVAQLKARPNLFDVTEALGWGMAIPIVFAVLGALIVARQHGNRVGWLMLIIALVAANPISIPLDRLLEHFASAPPETLTLGLWFLLWFDGWSWIPLIFPIFLIPLHFPTGRPPSPRWRWVNRLAVGMWLLFVVLGSFVDTVGPTSNGDWSLPNPIGFIPADKFTGPFLIFWGIGLLTMVSGSVISLFVRYRRAQFVEREQIKWLLFAGAFFVIVYGLLLIKVPLAPEEGPLDNGLTNLLFVLSILAFPSAIAIAILRYRLYDIDIIIRKTVQYTVLTALLALVYFGSIVLLQSVVERFTGEQSPVVIVFSTLLIAALFTPLRRRVQEVIDRRFFRQKYDAQQVLAGFALTARDETDLDALLAELERVVGDTLQPEGVNVWLKEKLP